MVIDQPHHVNIRINIRVYVVVQCIKKLFVLKTKEKFQHILINDQSSQTNKP